MTPLTYLLGLLGGAASALQSTVNGRLGVVVGPLNAAVVSTTVGLVSLVAFALASRQLDPAQVAKSPPVLLVGGALGAFFVTSIIYVVPRLGVVTAVMLAILGQLAIAALTDELGLFGNPRIGLTAPRLVGMVLVVLGFLLARSQ